MARGLALLVSVIVFWHASAAVIWLTFASAQPA